MPCFFRNASSVSSVAAIDDPFISRGGKYPSSISNDLSNSSAVIASAGNLGEILTTWEELMLRFDGPWHTGLSNSLFPCCVISLKKVSILLSLFPVIAHFSLSFIKILSGLLL